jgi:hypothetical protein
MGMKISELIELLRDELRYEGDTEIFIYDSSGFRIEPTCLMRGQIQRGTKTEDYAYISNI